MPTLEDLSVHAWIQKHGIKTEAGIPLDFRNHLYLYDIYRDWSPRLVCLKAAQIGFTTLAIIKSFYGVHKHKLDAIYTLPTQADVNQFAGGKVNRIIANNPILQTLVKEHDTVEQKSVGTNIIYYRGTFTEKAAIMVSSDWNIYDEEDRSNQRVIDQYASRLQHSKHKWEWHFSNPSVEGNGVSRFWNLSDQKHWFIRCPVLTCSREQFLSWPDSIDLNRRAFVCKHCDSSLPDESRRVGRWVKKYKDREYSGYWISLLMAPWITAGEIIDAYNTKNAAYFYNFVLGLPYVGGGNKVTKDMIMRNLIPEMNDQSGRIIIGVDTGKHVHFVCGNDKGIFYYSHDSDFNVIEGLMKRWERSVAVFDAGGDLHYARQLREKYPGRVFLVHYAVDRKTSQLIRWGEGDEFGNVIADRNRMIQYVIDHFNDRRIPLQGTEEDWYDYWTHWNAIYRTEEENALGTMTRKWERSGADHWVHATVYWMIGMQKFGQGGGELLGSKGLNLPSTPSVEPDGSIAGPPTAKLMKGANPLNDDWRT